MIARRPSRTYRLEEVLPAIPYPTASWPWGITPKLMAWSSAVLKHPLGTVIEDVVDGHPIVAQIQTHYGYGAHPEWAQRAHKGTSARALADASGKIIADPPEGWGDGPDDAFSGEAGGPRRDAGWALGAAGLALGASLGGPLGAVAGIAVAWALHRRLWPAQPSR